MNDKEEHRENWAARLDRWAKELQPLISQWKHKFEVSLWKNKPEGNMFHDRYIITDQCGISVSGGLDFVEDPRKANRTTMTWLEPKIIEEILLREFHLKKSPYLHLGSRKIG